MTYAFPPVIPANNYPLKVLINGTTISIDDLKNAAGLFLQLDDKDVIDVVMAVFVIPIL